MRRVWIRGLEILVLVGIGTAIGYYLPHTKPHPTPQTTPATSTEIRQTGYHYINPLLECETGPSLSANTQLGNLAKELNTQISAMYQQNKVTRVAIYIRDLNNGPWFGINETDQFTPASLLKTPLMIAYLKAAETEPDLLKRKLTYNPSGDQNAPESPTPGVASMVPHMSYTVEELISRMIIYSDNNAFQLLTTNIDYQLVTRVMQDLGLKVPSVDTPEDFVTVRQYAGIFRVLYNSSYLSRAMSEKALSILASAVYHDGLVKGVGDDSIEIAHKYGVRKGNDRIDQLHDCGIIYYPDHPYLVCIMTKGHDFKTMTSAIQDLTRSIHTEITSHTARNPQ